MGRRAKALPASVAESPAQWRADNAKPLPVKFYARFLYLLDQLAEKWTVADHNRSETLRICIDRFARDPQPPHPWAKARPRQPRAPRTENPMRPRRLEAPEGPPVEQRPFNPVLTMNQVDLLTRWAGQYGSNRTAVMYEAIWQAALAEQLIEPDAPVDLSAPAEWAAER